MDTSGTVDRLMAALRRAAHAEGPEQAAFLLAEVVEECVCALAFDRYAFADALAVEHRALMERR